MIFAVNNRGPFKIARSPPPFFSPDRVRIPGENPGPLFLVNATAEQKKKKQLQVVSRLRAARSLADSDGGGWQRNGN